MDESESIEIPEGYTAIYNREDLEKISENLAGKYILVKNINLSETEWTPIGTESAPFTGTLDGKGYKITGLTINATTQYQGLFGYIGSGAIIKNLEIENASITGSSYLGILAGYSIGHEEISNIKITGGTVTSTRSYAGGLLGVGTGISENETVISKVRVEGVTVTGMTDIGGLIGRLGANITVEKSYTTGSVKAKESASASPYAGGLIGYAKYVEITNTYAIGEVTGVDAGGLIAASVATTVTNSYWNTETSGIATSYGREEGKRTEEMSNQETYVGWNFINIWEMKDGYPKLR